MIKHILRMLIFLITLGIGFLCSPIRFSAIAVGSGRHGGFTAFESTDFVKLSLTREPYESVEEADNSFEDHKKGFEEIVLLGKHYSFIYRDVLVSENNRALVFNRMEDGYKGYCSIRRNENRIYGICSESLWHVLEFEKQYFPK